MTPPHDLPAPGRRQTLYILYDEFAEPCVFVKQSIPSSFCPRFQLKDAKSPHLQSGSLLPKLQEHFAEFLSWSSLTRLRMLSSPTCVGFRYESTLNSLRHFSRTYSHGQLPGTLLPSDSHLRDNCEADFAYLTPLRGCTSIPITGPP